MTKLRSGKLHICAKVTKMGSKIGHRIDWGRGSKRPAPHTQQKLTQKESVFCRDLHLTSMFFGLYKKICLKESEVCRKVILNKIIVLLVTQGLPTVFSSPVLLLSKFDQITNNSGTDSQGVMYPTQRFLGYSSESKTRARVKLTPREKGAFLAFLARGDFHSRSRFARSGGYFS